MNNTHEFLRTAAITSIIFYILCKVFVVVTSSLDLIISVILICYIISFMKQWFNENKKDDDEDGGDD